MSFNLIHYFHTCCATFWLVYMYPICVLPRQRCACASIFSSHYFFLYFTGCTKSSFLWFHALYLLIKTFFLLEISRRCLFHYREHVFRILVTDIPFLLLLLFSLSHSVAVAAWSGIHTACRPQVTHFELFYHMLRRSQFSSQTMFLWFRQLEKIYILGIHPKKIIVPFDHSKAFGLLYKFKTSWTLLGRLSRVFFLAISGASNFLNILNSCSLPFLDLAC